MKNILLCNNAMGVGGVETVILNQITAFVKKGYKVYVLAGKGIYSEKIKELGGEFIEFDFPEENIIDNKKINKIISIIKEKAITEIHIHKYQCILSVMPAALITGVPYFAYEHGIRDTKKYYTWNYPIYKEMFQIYFQNAYKIITITPNVIEYTRELYNIPKEKYEIIHNGIDFDLYKNPNPKYNEDVNQIYIITRFSNEKLTTILGAIDIFKKIIEYNPNAKLNIIGNGQEKEKIIEYIKNANLTYGENSKDTNINLLGEKNDIISYLKEADLLLGVDRCILEAIAMKVPAVITGYEGIKGLISKENMDVAMEENFSGDNMQTIEISECIKQIQSIKSNRKEIVDNNYNIATEKLDCFKNYINIPDDTKIDFDWIGVFKILEKNRYEIENQYIDIKAKYDWIQKIEEENKNIKEENQKIKEENQNIKNENNDLQEELNKIYNSKQWKFLEKFINVFHKK